MEVENFSLFSITRVYNKIYAEEKSYPKQIKHPVIKASPKGKNKSQLYSNIIGIIPIEPTPNNAEAK